MIQVIKMPRGIKIRNSSYLVSWHLTSKEVALIAGTTACAMTACGLLTQNLRGAIVGLAISFLFTLMLHICTMQRIQLRGDSDWAKQIQSGEHVLITTAFVPVGRREAS